MIAHYILSGYHCKNAERATARTPENDELLLLNGSPGYGSTSGDGGTANPHTYDNTLQRRTYSTSPSRRRQPVTVSGYHCNKAETRTPETDEPLLL